MSAGRNTAARFVMFFGLRVLGLYRLVGNSVCGTLSICSCQLHHCRTGTHKNSTHTGKLPAMNARAAIHVRLQMNSPTAKPVRL